MHPLRDGLNFFQKEIFKLQRLAENMRTGGTESRQVRSQLAAIDDLSLTIGKQLFEQSKLATSRPLQEANAIRARNQKLSKDFRTLQQQFLEVKESTMRKLEAYNVPDR